MKVPIAKAKHALEIDKHQWSFWYSNWKEIKIVCGDIKLEQKSDSLTAVPEVDKVIGY